MRVSSCSGRHICPTTQLSSRGRSGSYELQKANMRPGLLQRMVRRGASPLERLACPRRSRCLRVQRLPVTDAALEELRPVRHDRHRVGGFRQQPPQVGVVPAQLVSHAVAVLADAVRSRLTSATSCSRDICSTSSSIVSLLCCKSGGPSARHSRSSCSGDALRENLPKEWLAEWATRRERQVNEARRRRGLR